MKIAVLALVLAAVLVPGRSALARPCWWNGYEWVCRYPEHRPFWWRQEHEPRWQEREWERRHDPEWWYDRRR